MATIDEARRAFERKFSAYRKNMPTRTAYLGDGRGYAASNLYESARPDLQYARTNASSADYFVIVNDAVRPMHNLPVILGYTEDDPTTERVLNTNIAILGQFSAASALLGPGNHHPQHDFDGGDTVFIDSRQFKAGLVRPTNPASMQLQVESFVYFYKKWNFFSGGKTADLTALIPSTNGRYVSIAFDPDSGTLLHIPGKDAAPTYSSGDSWVTLINESELDFSDKFPSPGNNYPLATIMLRTGMTKIEWVYLGEQIIYDTRLHIGYPGMELSERVSTLESQVGSDPSLPATGAANTITEENFTIDGGLV